MSATTESISLSSNEIPQLTEENQKNITAKLTQIKKWKKQAKVIQILDKNFLHITQFDGRKKSFWINLLFLNKVYKRKLKIEWKWLLASAIMAALTAAVFFLDQTLQLTAKFKYTESVAIICATLAAILFVTFVSKIQNSTVFYSRKSNVPLFEIFHNSPTKAEYQKFLELLSIITAKQQSTQKFPPDQFLAGELAELRRFKEARMVSEAQYNQARSRLLSKH